MGMKFIKEEQVLDPIFRSKVLKEIKSPENIDRKNEFLKRFEVYKDMTSKWVVRSLLREGLSPTTVSLMETRASNVSICKKVVDKLARAYLGGVTRETGDDAQDEQISELSRLLDFDQKMKKANRYLELYKNTLIQVVPEQTPDELWKLKLKNLSPWQYDVLEDAKDREKPRVIILSDFVDRDGSGVIPATEAQAAEHKTSALNLRRTNARDDIIADAPEDSGRNKDQIFIWWTDEYHFTTNSKGAIIPELSPEGGINPIGMMPFCNIAEDQDGQFWARGGDDLVDGSILINKLLTDMFAIAYMQGWGQVVVTGKNLPEKLTIGPHHAMLFDYSPSDEEPEPKVTVVSPNPPLGDWMASIEQYTALLLSTNNLSPRMVANKLDVGNFPSGIALLIEMSEATQDIEDKQKMFKDCERRIWEIIRQWQNLFLDVLVDKFKIVGEIPELDLSIKFQDQKPVITEAEKLANIKARKDLGINEEVELIMLDNPDLTREEAEEKLLRIKEEKMNKMADALQGAMENGDVSEEEEKEEAETSEVRRGTTGSGGEVAHTHDYEIDKDGNGSTTSTSDGPGHTHDIIDSVIQPAGAGPHDHAL